MVNRRRYVHWVRRFEGTFKQKGYGDFSVFLLRSYNLAKGIKSKPNRKQSKKMSIWEKLAPAYFRGNMALEYKDAWLEIVVSYSFRIKKPLQM